MKIKFRAWDKSNECYLEDTCEPMNDNLHIECISGKEYEVTEWGYIDMELGTGMKDHKGNEIFEGDLVKGLNRWFDSELNKEDCFQVFKVDYLNGCFMVGNWNMQEYFNRFTYIEVIGNTHETDLMDLIK